MNIKDIKKLIDEDRTSPRKTKAKEGLKYYKAEHDILNFRLYYYDKNGNVVEDKYRSNVKIPHAFHAELVDQKVNYLLSNPLDLYVEDESFKQKLDEYINEDFHQLLQDTVEGASNKAREFIYAYVNEEGKLEFDVADSLGVVEVINNDKLEAILRYYDVVRRHNNKDITLTRVELWDDKEVTYYIQDSENNSNYRLDDTVAINPRPHVILEDSVNVYGDSLGYIPFFKLSNNKYEKTDLEPIKALIDDYDLMACSLSNNLQDFQDALYVVKGYNGDSLDTLIQNIKTRKTVGVDEDGGIDIKTVDIPVDARKTKLTLDKENIYKFGMGFDSTQLGDGNITNVVIKSRYSLLDLKCNKIEIRLRKLIRQLLKAITNDINKRHNTNYDYQAIEFELVKDMMINENDVATNEKLKEEAKAQAIENILGVSARLDDDTVLKTLCEILELDYEEIKENIDNQLYAPIDLNKASEGDIVE